MGMDTAEHGPVQTRPFGTGWSEAVLAVRGFLSQPGRIVRFAGWPWLVVCFLLPLVILAIAPGTVYPITIRLTGSWGVALFFSYTLLYCAAMVRTMACWFRWSTTGEDGVGFSSLGLGRRELMLAIFVVMAGLGLMLAILMTGGSLLLVSTIIEGGKPGLFTLTIMAVGASTLSCFLMARLGPGLVPVALGGTPEFGLSWVATEHVWGRVFLTLILLAVFQWIVGLVLQAGVAVFSRVSPEVGAIVAALTIVVSTQLQFVVAIVMGRVAAGGGLLDRMAATDTTPLANPLAR